MGGLSAIGAAMHIKAGRVMRKVDMGFFVVPAHWTDPVFMSFGLIRNIERGA